MLLTWRGCTRLRHRQPGSHRARQNASRSGVLLRSDLVRVDPRSDLCAERCPGLLTSLSLCCWGLWGLCYRSLRLSRWYLCLRLWLWRRGWLRGGGQGHRRSDWPLLSPSVLPRRSHRRKGGRGRLISLSRRRRSRLSRLEGRRRGNVPGPTRRSPPRSSRLSVPRCRGIGTPRGSRLLLPCRRRC